MKTVQQVIRIVYTIRLALNRAFAVDADPSAEGFFNGAVYDTVVILNAGGSSDQGEQMTGNDSKKKRPKKMNQVRERQIHIRVSDQELVEIRAAANAKGVGISRYLVEAHETCIDLEAARKECETNPIVEQLKAVKTEIWRIGHNVNQIARNANRDMGARLDDEYSAAKAVKDCKRLFAKASTAIKELSN